ncbi:hypothetical protein SLS60_005802 [Paraconiothyrium brasiliense]|uniref:Heterokaryon incompatibility domain-containing protein n=1 Tax=Paraconiothyrium brasiliense TaxID=300254 RepID=A0ABR3RD92_9PLEO
MTWMLREAVVTSQLGRATVAPQAGLIEDSILFSPIILHHLRTTMESGDISDEPHTLATNDKPAAGPTPSASIYHPLPAGNFFRFLRLEPGNGTDPLRGKLEILAIDEVVDEYEAISYVWGDPTVTEVITCNDVAINVTTNLADALRSFRFTNKKRVLWADAICINQQDIEERGSQVQRMDQVYMKAKHVLAWLGRDPDILAKECFYRIEETNKYLDSRFIDKPPETLPKSHPICQDRKSWLPVDTFLKLPYFRRVWVVQEVALAKDCELWWGTEHLSVAQLFEFANWYLCVYDLRKMLKTLNLRWERPAERISGLLLTVYRHYSLKALWRFYLPLIGWCSSVQQSEQEPRLIPLLWIASGMETTDPRDRVYALIGIPLARTPHGETVVKPNCNLSMEEVYFETACALLQNEYEAPWLLSFAERNDRKSVLDHRSPSWIPTWHIRPNVMGISNDQCLAGGIAQGLPAFVDYDSKTLQVTGSIFDKIVWLSDYIEYDDLVLDPSDWSDEVRASGKPLIVTLWELVSAFKRVAADDFALTMVAGRIGPNFLSERPSPLGSFIEHFVLYLEHATARKAIPEDETVRLRLYDIELTLSASANRRLAVTEGGHLALVSGAITRVGDVCCVIVGMRMPFILTPVGEKRYRLVCQSYIRGFMKGEIAQEIEEGVREKEVIIIA